ncbi:MAG: hypothetical protein LBT46_11290, partial [Planctomycetaceae bacterium]|nr:hypothetical protein [Planctomycetaceae bacterium]
KTASGEPLPVETTLIRVPWEDGYRLAAFSRDMREEKAQKQKITEADNLNRQLDIEKKAAQRAIQMRNEFLANLSHEFLTPMNAIQGFLNLVLMSPLSPQQRQWLKRTEEAAKSLLSVINNVLEISSLESGKLNFVSRFFCLDNILQNLNKEFLPKAQTKELFFEIKCPADIPNQLIGDAVRLEQVLSHLLSNAFKFTPSGNVVLDIQISDSSRADDGETVSLPGDMVMLQFAVRDTGIGMTLEEQNGLFHSYTQADASTTREYSGTGVGLAICKGIVELMGGKIWCESTPQQGSTFYATACFEVGKR